MERHIALIPDRFALYRYPVFRLISEYRRSGSEVVIFADPREDPSRVRLAPTEFCSMDPDEGGIRWQKIRSFYFRNICFWQTGLQRLAFSRKFRVIVYWGEAHRVSTWLSATIAKSFGKKVVFWTHGIYGNEGRLKKIIRTCFYRLADTILLYSEHGRQELVSAGIPAERLHVINNSLDVSAQLEVLNSIDDAYVEKVKRGFCEAPERLLVFIGRLEPQKCLHLLIHAVARLRKRGSPVKALLIGDGIERSALSQLAMQLGVENDILFYGECYDDAVIVPLLAVSDICVSPGEVGLTAMHALVCGTPVISHDDFPNQMPEFEAIKVGKSGAFYRRGDVEDLVKRISTCLADIDSGRITPESCREQILSSYTPEFQRSVFYRAIDPLLA
ncbi:Glycosyltransferase involved in cell wall bisynthesis [Microbulbifer donghaiensis]|uniref:Glycosyltransferase involved in cell wall bisynthesis n=1 Tax=Microbulbifer donghaiensis TaxID=494016 RepID=A0A1M4TYR0_9GAMM|nr:glycosyltransferase [Microbulbifer donghaiensis]SHE49651.1 Glycosyltransferase involved in cell wall bisynthesis [Microbulbifer donghaiensis]